MKKLFIILFISLVLTNTSILLAASIPWSKIDQSGKLSKDQKSMLEIVFRTAKSYANCDDTLFNCLIKNGNDKAVLRQGKIAVRRALKGYDAPAISEEIEKRKYSAFPEQAFKIDISRSIPLGNFKNLVKIVVYADFECPFCRLTAPAISALTKKYPKNVVYYFKNFPLKSHKHSVPTSLALLAAGKQGKFWEMHEKLYKTNDLSDATIDMTAKMLGLDIAKFRKDLKSKELLDQIRKEKEEGIIIGVEGTPSIYINGKFYYGKKSYDEIEDRILEEIDIIKGIQKPVGN